MTAQRSMWTVGAALVAFVLAAAGWMLLLSPVLDRTAALDEQREMAEDRNDLLSVEVAGLARDFARLGELQAEVAQIRTQFPQVTDLPELARDLGRMVEDTGATVRSVQVGAPAELTEIEKLTEAMEPTAVDAPAGMYAVSVSLTVEGTMEQARAYLDRLQSPVGRLTLVSRASVSLSDDVATIVLSGHTYVLVDPAAVPSTEAGA